MMKPNLRWLGDRGDLTGSAVLVAGLISFVVLDRTQLGVALVGLGLFGPSLLREAGLLRWRDDFHRDVTVRAALHALLVVGVLLTVVMVVDGVGGSGSPANGWEIKDRISASAILFPLAMTWWLSRFLQFWGAQSGSRRLLVGFFAIAAVALVSATVTAGQSGSDVVSAELLVSMAQISWIGLLAAGVVRWPHQVGWLLLATVATRTHDLVAAVRQDTGEPALVGLVLELCMWLPLLLAGFALVMTKRMSSDVAPARAGS